MIRLFAKVLMLVGCLTISTQLLALGLGELTLRSALNQPLDAELELVDAEGLSQWEIKPFLASSVAFERAGVERPYFLTKMRFKVEGQKIRLTTKDPVTEPFLNFLIELNWPSGRVLREYTVLLDPPTFADDRYQPLATSPASGMETTEFQDGNNQAYQPRTQRDIPPAPAPVERATQSGVMNTDGADTYRVKPNDTLWSIALQTRPSRDVTPQQMMLAIQGENPEAFIAGNINRLKTHHVLRIPDQDRVGGISFEAAVSEVARQNRDVNAGPAQLDATGRDFSTGPDQKATTGGEVKLVSAKNREARSAGAGGDVTRGSGGRQEALENELAISLENLDKTRRENKDLRDRLVDLEDQINAMQRLISLKDSQLASMQATASTATDSAISDTSGVVSEPSGVNTRSPIVDAEHIDAEKPETAGITSPADTAATAQSSQVASSPQATQVPPAPVQPRRQYTPPPPPKSFIDGLLEDPVTLGGGLAALLLLIAVAVLYLRKRKEGESDDSAADDTAIAEPISLDIEQPADKEAVADADGFDDLNNFNFDTSSDDSNDLMADVDLGGDLFADPTAPVTDAETDGAESVSAADAGGNVEGDSVEDDSVDVSGLDFGDEEDDLFELVDLDVAYGRFDDAVDRLQGVLDTQPGRSDVRLRLLELLVEMGDAQQFVEQENAVIETGDPELTQQAADLRQLLSDPIEPTAQPRIGDSVDVDEVASEIDISIDEIGTDLGETLDDGIAFGDALDISDSDSQVDDFDFDEESAISVSDDEAGVDDLLDLATLEAELDDEFTDETADDLNASADAEDSDVGFDLSSLAEQLDEEESTEQAELDDSNLMEFDLEGLDDDAELLEEASSESESLDEPENSMEFDIESLNVEEDSESVTEEADLLSEDDNAMEFDLDSIETEEDAEEDAEEEQQMPPAESDDNLMEFDLDSLEEEQAEDESASVPAENTVESDGNTLEFDAGVLEEISSSDETELPAESLEFEEESQVDFDLDELESELDSLSDSDFENVDHSDLNDTNSSNENSGQPDIAASLSALGVAEESLEALMDGDGGDHGEFDLAGLQSEFTTDDAGSHSDDLAALDAELNDTLPELSDLETLNDLDSLDDLDSLEELEELPELDVLDVVADETEASDELPELTDVDELPELTEELPELTELDDLPELSPLDDVVDMDVASDEIPELDDLEELPELAPETGDALAAAAVVAAAATGGAVMTRDIDLEALAKSEDEFDFLAGTDECDTKLELAQEYLNMGDEDGARELLGEVVTEGTDPQIKKARELLDTFA